AGDPSGAARAGDEGRGSGARGIHGRRARRPERASGPHRGNGEARLDADHSRHGSAGGNVRLRYGHALSHAGEGVVYHALPEVRADAGEHRRGSDRPCHRQGGGEVSEMVKRAGFEIEILTIKTPKGRTNAAIPREFGDDVVDWGFREHLASRLLKKAVGLSF